MNRWLSVEFYDFSQIESFQQNVNRYITNNYDKTYFKIFTPKYRENKYRVFYIADEGNPIVELLVKDFNFNICEPPERRLITRVAGASKDRTWMLK